MTAQINIQAGPSPARTGPATDAQLDALASFVGSYDRLFVLSGAGCSTESGIPDYRDPDGTWKRGRPVEFRPFVTDPLVRARYWARSLIGWARFGAARPNAAHLALAALERAGLIGILVTQNVDRLHQAAGSRRVIDLHGRLDRVVCLTCRHGFRRTHWQERLASLNAVWAGLDASIAPDGDADLDVADFGGFTVPDCPRCGGVIKPDVVFFGESVPPWRHAQARASLVDSAAMLVVGSSLMVYSGYRYAVAASRAGIPIAAVNLGVTRADHMLTLKVEAPVGSTLSALLA